MPFRVTTSSRAGKDVNLTARNRTPSRSPAARTRASARRWEIPSKSPADWPRRHKPLSDFWEARIARQREIDASIAARAEFEFLYDQPVHRGEAIRVAGPSQWRASPRTAVGVDENDELIDPRWQGAEPDVRVRLSSTILENLKAAGVHRRTRRTGSIHIPQALAGRMVCAEGRYMKARPRGAPPSSSAPNTAPSSADLVQAAREAGEAGFDVLIACAFNYEAHASDSAGLAASRCSRRA